MLKSGLCSVTFRSAPVDEVVAIAQAAGLDAIEWWAGAAHVEPGNFRAAERVRQLCKDAGIAIPSYGSYYRAGIGPAEGGQPFEPVLETALALGAGTIRVWAADRDYDAADESLITRTVDDTFRIAELAGRHGLTVAFEYHQGSFTNSNSNASAFSARVARDNILFYWQPPNGHDFEYCMSGLVALGGRLANLHVFHWTIGAPDRNTLAQGRDQVRPEDYYRHPLSDGITRWREYLRYAAGLAGNRHAFLEFVKDDSKQSMMNDAKTLREMLREAADTNKE